MLEWSGEVRNITYSADAKSVSVVYRVTLYGTDAEVPTYHFTLHKEIHYSILCISFTDTSITKSNQTNPLWCFGQCMKGERIDFCAFPRWKLFFFLKLLNFI